MHPVIEELREATGVDPQVIASIAEEELERRKIQARLLSDPFLFYSEVICPPRWKPLLAPFHREALEFVQKGKRFKLLLLPRKHLKTTLFTECETLRRALLEPDIRIQLNTAVSDNARRFLSSIRGHLLNPRFTQVFGDLLPPMHDKFRKNNASELTLMTRQNLGLREPTFSASGVGEAHTSQHYDLIVHDDLMNRDNISNIDQISKVILHYKDSLDLLENDGEMWVIGTRWHPLDITGWIMEDLVDPRCRKNDFIHVDNKCTCNFDVMLRTVKEGDDYIFPARFDNEVMDQLERQKDRYQVACQYYNNPIDPSACWFTNTDIKKSEISPQEIQEKRDNLVWYIMVDPAESIEKVSSYTAAVAVGVDFSVTPAVWYVDFAKRDKVETPGFLNLCMEVHRRYPNHAAFGMEQNTRKALGYALKERMLQANDHFTITELKPSDVRAPGGFTKELRIKRLLPLWEFGRIRVNNQCKDLLDELYTLPAARSWDLTDALSYGMSLVPEGAGGISNEVKLPRRVIGWPGTGL